MLVEIGGGPEPRYRNWIQYDAIDWRERTGLDYVIGDIRQLPWQDGTVDAIYASNVLEHVSFLDTNRVLVEWRRVLKPGGELTVVVPDLLGLIADYQQGVNSWTDFVERVYGAQTYELDFHCAGFTFSQMPTVFNSAGFETLSCHQTHAGGGVTIVGTPKGGI